MGTEYYNLNTIELNSERLSENINTSISDIENILNNLDKYSIHNYEVDMGTLDTSEDSILIKKGSKINLIPIDGINNASQIKEIPVEDVTPSNKSLMIYDKEDNELAFEGYDLSLQNDSTHYHDIEITSSTPSDLQILKYNGDEFVLEDIINDTFGNTDSLYSSDKVEEIISSLTSTLENLKEKKVNILKDASTLTEILPHIFRAPDDQVMDNEFGSIDLDSMFRTPKILYPLTANYVDRLEMCQASNYQKMSEDDEYVETEWMIEDADTGTVLRHQTTNQPILMLSSPITGESD